MDADSSWTFESDRERPRIGRTDRVCFGPGALIANRPGVDVWSGQGPFHHGARWPVTPIRVTDRFGRSAWSVGVRSAGGSAPDNLVVDDETGTVLSWRAPDAGWSAQWDDFTVGAPVPAGWFTWAGPTVSVADLEAGEQQRQQAGAVARNEWFRAHVGPIPLELLLAHEVRVESLDEDTGEFTADVGFGRLNQLARRRRSAQPWVHPTPGHWIGWSDADWDWAVRVEGSMPAEGLRLLQQQLHSSRCDDQLKSAQIWRCAPSTVTCPP